MSDIRLCHIQQLHRIASFKVMNMYTSFAVNWREDILPLMPGRAAAALRALPAALADRLTEVRMGAGRPLTVCDCQRDWFLAGDGQSTTPAGALTLTADESRDLLQSLTRYSAYAYEEELRNGFLTLRGGYRVGVAGRAVLRGGALSGFGAATSFCIRIPRELRGVAADLYGAVRTAYGIRNTLVVSPPGMGKTTLLRDLTRMLSCGHAGHSGLRTCVVDERSELGGGERRFDLGCRTDVLDGCPKAQGILLALRSLGPQLLVTDEVGRAEDAVALQEALNCGVGVLASAHGAGPEDLHNRTALRALLEGGFFGLFIILDGSRGVGGVTAVVRAGENVQMAGGAR